MADQKLTQLTALTALASDDLLLVTDDPGGTPASKSITAAKLLHYEQTTAESTAAVTPTNYQYEPGNVLRYGTNTTPGTTDMSTAFTNALSVGIPVIVPEGTYAANTITVPDDAVIYGENATLQDSGGTLDCLDVAGSAKIRGLNFTGFRYDIDINAAVAGSDIDIECCTFTSDQRGISGDRAGSAEVLCGRLRVVNCKFDSLTEYGIFTRKQGWDSVLIDGNYMRDFSSTGLCVGVQVGHSVETTTNVKIKQVIIANNTFRNFHTTNGDALSDAECHAILCYSDEYVIDSNAVRDFTTDAASSADCEGIIGAGRYGIVSNNNCYDAIPAGSSAAEGAIVCKAAERVTVTGNNIYFSAGSKAGGDAMTINATESIVSGNRIENADRGIGIDSGADRTISGNRISNTTTGIFLNSDYSLCTITGNTLDNVSVGINNNVACTGRLVVDGNVISNALSSCVTSTQEIASLIVNGNTFTSDPTDTDVVGVRISDASAGGTDDVIVTGNKFIGFDTSGDALLVSVSGLTIGRLVFDHNTCIDNNVCFNVLAGTVTEAWVHFNNAVDCTDPYSVAGTITTVNKNYNIGTWT